MVRRLRVTFRGVVKVGFGGVGGRRVGRGGCCLCWLVGVMVVRGCAANGDGGCSGVVDVVGCWVVDSRTLVGVLMVAGAAGFRARTVRRAPALRENILWEGCRIGDLRLGQSTEINRAVVEGLVGESREEVEVETQRLKKFHLRMWPLRLP